MDIYEGLYGGYGLGEANIESKTISDFSLAFNFTITNTCIRKQKKHIRLILKSISFL